MRAVLVQNMWETYAEFGEICTKICRVYAAYTRHYENMWRKWRVRVFTWTKCAEMLKKCDRICGNMQLYANFCKFMH